MRKYLYVTLGTISLCLGLLGIVTPGLPTTPFILLTGYLYMRSSPKLYQKLNDNKITGSYLRRMSTGLSLKARLISIAFMWCMVLFSAFVIFDYGTMRFVMFGLGAIGTIAQLIVLRKKKKPETIQVESNEKEGSEKSQEYIPEL